MKNPKLIVFILSVLNIVSCIALNAKAFSLRSPVTEKNFIVTLAYIIIWIFILTIGIKIKKSEIIVCCAVFWSQTLFISLLLLYFSTMEVINVGTVICIITRIFTILCLCPLCGIKFLVGASLIHPITVSIISLIIVIVTVISFKNFKIYN